MAAYQKLFKSGELAERVSRAQSILKNCRLCGHSCRVNRVAGFLGKCGTGKDIIVSSYGPHFGEEAPLIGKQGSGTIFFTNCNLKCIYCQNYSISHLGEGNSISVRALAQMMLDLQKRGCHNINLVSPTHQVPQILEALELAAAEGLVLPLVYNTGGYDSGDVLKILEGIVDIYMPDMKYSDGATAGRLSGAIDYPEVNRRAIKEMYRQMGDLITDEFGVAVRGLLVRHLVLPWGLAGTKEVVGFLATEISLNTYLNVMAQYHPCYHAFGVPELARRLSGEEYAQAVKMALDSGLKRLDKVHSAPVPSINHVADEI